MMEGGYVKSTDNEVLDNNTVWPQVVKVLHKEIMTHELAWPFLEPVDPIKLNIPTYFQIIEKPMDFGTMQNKLLGSHVIDEQDDLSNVFGNVSASYTSLDEYKQDLLLVFGNAIKFNGDDGREESVGNIAKRLRQHSLRLLTERFGETCLTWDEKMELRLLDRKIACAKEQDLRGRWKQESFVARMNRQKIQQRIDAIVNAES